MHFIYKYCLNGIKKIYFVRVYSTYTSPFFPVRVDRDNDPPPTTNLTELRELISIKIINCVLICCSIGGDHFCKYH